MASGFSALDPLLAPKTKPTKKMEQLLDDEEAAAGCAPGCLADPQVHRANKLTLFLFNF